VVFSQNKPTEDIDDPLNSQTSYRNASVNEHEIKTMEAEATVNANNAVIPEMVARVQENRIRFRRISLVCESRVRGLAEWIERKRASTFDIAMYIEDFVGRNGFVKRESDEGVVWVG
jgi:hypothetical protein